MITDAQRYYDALYEIARNYASATDLAQDEDLRHGLDYGEALEIAYDNIREEAARAIYGKRRPESDGQ